ncbi:MAG TPA: ABC transporter substrate-binding protein [Candidatus Dormibacteraeota bacterium]|nr:ABC transporter substrate-binding protein [Candidatus Dormibacteraeota bacterium]
MISPSPSRRPLQVGTVLAGIAMAMAACGSSNTSSSGGGGSSQAATTATKVASLASEVPSAIASKHTLVVAADATYAPNEFIGPDGSTVQGMDADLAVALAQVLGLSVQVTNVKFDNILPGMGTKYDLGMSSFTDTKEREASYDFVTYFIAGSSFIVKTSGGPTINTLDDLCGHHVAVERGTTQLDDATAQKKKCTDAGKADVDVQPFDDQNGANLALHSGRAEVGMADSPVAAYAVKQSSGEFKLSGQPYGTAPYGIAIPKSNGMAKPILDAVKELMSDGVYAAILAKWGIQAGSINNPQINGAAS